MPPIDFEDSDLEEILEEVREPQILQNRVGDPENSDASFDEQMTEVEKRLEMAQYYQVLLKDSIFDDPANPEVASHVEDEIREFIKGRMSLLVGVGNAPVKNSQQMTDQEAQLLREIANPEIIKVVKELASKLLKKPALMELKPKPMQQEAKVTREPTLKKAFKSGFKKKQPTNQEQPPAPVVTLPPKQLGRQKKVYRTITTEDGREIKQDLTPQARPTGDIQPIPTPRTRQEIEMTMARISGQHADLALSDFNKKLTGKQ